MNNKIVVMIILVNYMQFYTVLYLKIKTSYLNNFKID